MGLEAESADQEHKKAEAARAAAANGPARIARDLHDVIAPAVRVTIIQGMAARGWGHRCPRLTVELWLWPQRSCADRQRQLSALAG